MRDVEWFDVERFKGSSCGRAASQLACRAVEPRFFGASATFTA